MAGPVIYGLNVSHLFDKEMLMYAFGDIKLKKPISMKKILFVFVSFVLWTGPLVLFIGPAPELWLWVIWLVPPIFIGHYASKPVFNGKGLIDWTRTIINFMQQPRGWSDFNVDNDQEDTVFFIEHEVAISRRREIQWIADQALKRDPSSKKKPAPNKVSTPTKKSNKKKKPVQNKKRKPSK